MEAVEPNTLSPGLRLYLLISLSLLPIYLQSGFYYIESAFPFYDDFGAMLLQFNSFNAHKHLYDVVYSPYGPFHSEFAYLATGLGTLKPTHDRVGMFVLFIWILSSFLSGLFSFRLTAKASFGVMGQMLSFLALERLAIEPGHPISLCILLLSVLLFLLQIENNSIVSNALGGFVCGLLCATKINIGVFSILPLFASRMVFYSKTRLIFWSGYVAILLLPFFLTRSHAWPTEITNQFCLLLTIGSATILVRFLQFETPPKKRTDLSSIMLFSSGLAVGLFLSLGACILTGTTFSNMVNGMIVRPQHFGNLFSLQPLLSWTTTVNLVAVALLILFFSRLTSKAVYQDVKFFKTFSDVFSILLLIGLSWSIYRLIIDSALGILGVMPFLWLMFSNLGLKEIPSLAANEKLIFYVCLLTLCETLSAYPTFGNQIAVPLFLLSLLVPYAVDKASKIAEEFSGKRFFHLNYCFQVLCLLALFGFWSTSAKRYDFYYPLNLPGASLLRLGQPAQAIYFSLSKNLQLFYSGFLMVPARNSLYGWSELEPPNSLNTTANFNIFTEEEQNGLLTAFERQTPHLFIEDREGMVFWGQGRQSSGPLVEFGKNRTRAIGHFGPFYLREEIGLPVRKYRFDYCALFSPDWGKNQTSCSISILYPFIQNHHYAVSVLKVDKTEIKLNESTLPTFVPSEFQVGSRALLYLFENEHPVLNDSDTVKILDEDARQTTYVAFLKPVN